MNALKSRGGQEFFRSRRRCASKMGSVLETAIPGTSHDGAPRRILVVAQDASHLCDSTQFAVDRIAHHEAVARIASPEFDGYSAVVIQVTSEPSSASSAFRTGEYVLHYLHQLRPDALSRVVIYSEVPEFAPRVPVAAVVPPGSAPEAVMMAVRDCTPLR